MIVVTIGLHNNIQTSCRPRDGSSGIGASLWTACTIYVLLGCHCCLVIGWFISSQMKWNGIAVGRLMELFPMLSCWTYVFNRGCDVGQQVTAMQKYSRLFHEFNAIRWELCVTWCSWNCSEITKICLGEKNQSARIGSEWYRDYSWVRPLAEVWEQLPLWICLPLVSANVKVEAVILNSAYDTIHQVKVSHLTVMRFWSSC